MLAALRTSQVWGVREVHLRLPRRQRSSSKRRRRVAARRRGLAFEASDAAVCGRCADGGSPSTTRGADSSSEAGTQLAGVCPTAAGAIQGRSPIVLDDDMFPLPPVMQTILALCHLFSVVHKTCTRPMPALLSRGAVVTRSPL